MFNDSIPITTLPRRSGFAQRHFTFRERTPFLDGLSVDLHHRRSGVTKAGIKADILKFRSKDFDFTKLLNSNFNLQLAVALAKDAFRLPLKVPMLHLNDVFDYDLPIWSSSPGYPYKDRGYHTKGEVVADPHNRKMIRWYWHEIKHNRPVGNHDCCAFVRSHLTTGEDKVRAVWGYPANMTIGEAVYAVPLIEAFKQGSTPMAYGYETAVGGMKRILVETAKYKHFAAIDFKNFDKTIHPELIRIAFDILMLNIDFGTYRDYGVAFAPRNMRAWYHIVDYFINTPIRLCDGQRFQKHSGVASGSYFTQLIDSVVNYILLTWIYLELTGNPPDYIRVMGDDSIIGNRTPIDLDAAQDVVERVGMTINITKSGCSRNINRLKFLGFEVNYGWPLKSFDEWVALLLLPEHFDKSWDDVATRALGLGHANCGVEEKFDYLVREILNIQPFKINYSRGMVKFLAMLGIDDMQPKLPSKWDFMKRLKLP